MTGNRMPHYSIVKGQTLITAIMLSFAIACHAAIVDGSPSNDEVAGLIRHLHSTEISEQQDASKRLYQLGPKAANSMPLLLDAFVHDKNVEVRLAMAFFFPRMGAAARKTVPLLIDAVKHDHESRIRAASANALGNIISGEPNFSEALTHFIRRSSTEPVVPLDVVGKSALDALFDAAEADNVVNVRSTAIIAIEQLHPPFHDVSTRFLTLFQKETNPSLRRSIAQGLQFYRDDLNAIDAPLRALLIKERIHLCVGLSYIASER